MKHTYTKKDALRIVVTTAKEYAKSLEGMNYLFIYRNRDNNKIEFFEAVIQPVIWRKNQYTFIINVLQIRLLKRKFVLKKTVQLH